MMVKNQQQSIMFRIHSFLFFFFKLHFCYYITTKVGCASVMGFTALYKVIHYFSEYFI